MIDRHDQCEVIGERSVMKVSDLREGKVEKLNETVLVNDYQSLTLLRAPRKPKDLLVIKAAHYVLQVPSVVASVVEKHTLLLACSLSGRKERGEEWVGATSERGR